MVVYLGILFDDADFDAESDSYNKDAEYDIDILIYEGRSINNVIAVIS